jgi:hypothetical protein
MKVSLAFLISEFTNPSGEIVFRVSGWLDGKRVRKNFPTRAEAQDEVHALEIKGLQGKTGIRATATRLTEDQLHEAESLYQSVAGLSHPLAFYVDFALANYREPSRQKALAAAVTEYVAAKEREHQQGHLSISQLTSIRRGLNRLDLHFAGLTVGELTVPRLTEYFNLGNPPATVRARQARRGRDQHRRNGLEGRRATQSGDSSEPRCLAPA